MPHRAVTDKEKNESQAGGARVWLVVLLGFLTITAGTFSAHQLSVRLEHKRAASSLAAVSERLRADMYEEAWIAAYMRAYWQQALKSARLAQSEIEGDGALSDEQFLIAAYRASQFTWWNRRRGAFEELMATGIIGAMDDAQLRSDSIFIYNSPLLRDVSERGARAPLRKTVRMILPTAVHDELGAQCGDRTIPMGDFAAVESMLDYDCTLKLPVAAMSAAAAALRADPSFARDLRLRIATIQTELGDLAEHEEMMRPYAGRATESEQK